MSTSAHLCPPPTHTHTRAPAKSPPGATVPTEAASSAYLEAYDAASAYDAAYVYSNAGLGSDMGDPASEAEHMTDAARGAEGQVELMQ